MAYANTNKAENDSFRLCLLLFIIGKFIINYNPQLIIMISDLSC